MLTQFDDPVVPERSAINDILLHQSWGSDVHVKTGQLLKSFDDILASESPRRWDAVKDLGPATAVRVDALGYREKKPMNVLVAPVLLLSDRLAADHEFGAKPRCNVASVLGLEIFVDGLLDETFALPLALGLDDGLRFLGDSWRNYVKNHGNSCTLGNVVQQITFSQRWLTSDTATIETPKDHGQNLRMSVGIAAVCTIVRTNHVSKVRVVVISNVIPQLLQNELGVLGHRILLRTIGNVGSKSPDIDAVIVGRIVLGQRVLVSLEQLVNILALFFGKVDELLVVLALANPACCEGSHDSWVGVSKNQVIVLGEGAVATHASDCSCFEGVFDARLQTFGEKMAKFFDNLDKLGAVAGQFYFTESLLRITYPTNSLQLGS
ncbi:hypothetical protein HG531_004696 [Fusarium graminearum]|nr:hypothetical protein HG531_004696 [Fusarium graminearum]